MSKETDLKESVASLLAADHQVRIVINDANLQVSGSHRDAGDPLTYQHSLQLTTKSEEVISAVLAAIESVGLPSS